MRIRNVKNAKEILKSSKYFIENPEEHKNFWNRVFDNDLPLKIEIGMGKGDFLIGMAKLHPECNFVGIENYESVLVRAVEKLENEELPNLKVMCKNASLIANFFGEEVDEIYLNFSDPWPKTRHHKRRLTHANFLKEYDKIFKSYPMIEFKTDSDALFEDSLSYLSQYGYILDKVSLDLWNAGLQNVRTEYETKFGGMGYKIKFLSAHKNRVDKDNKK